MTVSPTAATGHVVLALAQRPDRALGVARHRRDRTVCRHRNRPDGCVFLRHHHAVAHLVLREVEQADVAALVAGYQLALVRVQRDGVDCLKSTQPEVISAL